MPTPCPTAFADAIPAGLTLLNATQQGESAEQLQCGGGTPPLALETILVLYDFSEHAHALARLAASIALPSQATLRLLHVIEPTFAASRPWTAFTMSLDSERAQWREKCLRAFIIEELPPTLSVQADVRIGKLTEEAIACATAVRADLLLMTLPDPAGSRRFSSRNAVELIARQASCATVTWPKAMLRPPAVPAKSPASDWKTILVPAVCAEASACALRYAAALAHANRGRVVIVSVPGTAVDKARFEDGATRANERSLADWMKASPPPAFEVIVRIDSPPAPAILHEARRLKADVIVLGLQRWNERHRPSVNRTTEWILRHADCPVLTVPEATISRPPETLEAA